MNSFSTAPPHRSVKLRICSGHRSAPEERHREEDAPSRAAGGMFVRPGSAASPSSLTPLDSPGKRTKLAQAERTPVKKVKKQIYGTPLNPHLTKTFLAFPSCMRMMFSPVVIADFLEPSML